MKVNEIEKLLFRYYNGETTDAEEKKLKRYFLEEEVPDHLRTEKEYFMQLTADPELPCFLEHKLNHMIDFLEFEETQRNSHPVKRKRIYHINKIIGVAASLLILFSVGLYLYEPYRVSEPQDTCATPEEAYKEAQRALMIFSSTINKGMKQVGKVHNTAHKLEENVNRQLNELNTVKQ